MNLRVISCFLFPFLSFKCILKLFSSFCYDPAPSHHPVSPGPLCKLAVAAAPLLAVPEPFRVPERRGWGPGPDLVTLLSGTCSQPFSSFPCIESEPRAHHDGHVPYEWGPTCAFSPASSALGTLPFTLALVPRASALRSPGLQGPSPVLPIQVSAARTFPDLSQ